MSALFDLSGRTALVTGARRGIGLAMAEALALAGADVIGVSAQLESEGSAVEQRVRAAGRRFTGFRTDLGDRAAVYRLVEDVAALGSVDILVNNGGTIARAPAVDHPDEMWDRVVQVNLSSQFVLSREIGRQMVDRGHGKVIFTASLLSFQGGINVASYTAAKSGLAGLTRALANEWAGRGVNVNAIAPATSPPTTHRRCATTPTATRPSWAGSRPAGGDGPTTWPAPSSSWPPRPRTTCTAPSCPSTAAGSADDRDAAGRTTRHRRRTPPPLDPRPAPATVDRPAHDGRYRQRLHRG